MSFLFNWKFFDPETLYSQVKEIMVETMNKGPTPDVIVDDILVSEFDFGSVPPSLEMLEIGDLGLDDFRGIFKLDYAGDARLSLTTTVEANPLSLLRHNSPWNFVSPGFRAARQSLELPLSIELSDIRLNAIVILVFSRAKGLTLVFKNDPLESVKINSTFDSLPEVSGFIREEIEQRLNESFREDIPEMLYQLSQEKIHEQEDGGQHPLNFHPRDYNTITEPLITFSGSECSKTAARLKQISSGQATLVLGGNDKSSRPIRNFVSRAMVKKHCKDEEKRDDSEYFHTCSSSRSDINPRRRVIKLSNSTKQQQQTTECAPPKTMANPPEYYSCQKRKKPPPPPHTINLTTKPPINNNKK